MNNIYRISISFLVILWLSVDIVTAQKVTRVGDLKELVSVLESGSQVVELEDGEYQDLCLDLKWSGSKEQSIVIKAEHPGKLIEWFGRDIRKVSHGENTLLVSDKKISVHAFIKKECMMIDFNSKEQAQLSLTVPSQPVHAEINGRKIDYSFENGAMKFHMEGGKAQKLEIKFEK